MSDKRRFVIVGGGLAGAKAAEALRTEGFDGRVLMFGREASRPYSRPGLSKGYLRGERDVASLFVHNEEFYAANNIDLVLSTRVTRLSPNTSEVQIESGDWIRYDGLILATGARPRTINVPGGELDGIHYLRTLQDSDRLRYALRSASRVAVVGAGWIGSEVAASATQLGVETVLIDPKANPLEKVLGPEVGRLFRQLHEGQGVDFHPHTRVHSFVGDEFVEGVRTTTGKVIAADLVVLGIGVRPRTELAVSAGLHLQDGVAVDELLQTSAPGIFAAGDIASAWHPLFGRRLRVEHWANAREQGGFAARNLLGMAIPYDRIPHFLSDQYDFQIEYSGHAAAWDRVVFRGDPASGRFIAFWISDGRVAAGMSANIPGTHDAIETLVRSGRQVSIEELADADVPLDEILEKKSDDQVAATVR